MAIRVFAAEDIACPRRRSNLAQKNRAPTMGGEATIVNGTAVVFASRPSYEGQEPGEYPSNEGRL